MKKFEEKDYNEKVNFSTWKKIIRAIMSDKTTFIWMMLTISFLAILDVIHPILNSLIIDKYFSGDNVSFENSGYYVLAYVGIAVLYFIFTYVKSLNETMLKISNTMIQMQINMEKMTDRIDKIEEKIRIKED